MSLSSIIGDAGDLGDAISLGLKLGEKLSIILFGSETYIQTLNHFKLTFSFNYLRMIENDNDLLSITKSRDAYLNIVISVHRGLLEHEIKDSCGCGTQCGSEGSCVCTERYDSLRSMSLKALSNYFKAINNNYDAALKNAEEWLLDRYFQDFTDTYLTLRKNHLEEMKADPEPIKEFLREFGNVPEDNMSAAVEAYIDISVSYLDDAYNKAKSEFISSAELDSRILDRIKLPDSLKWSPLSRQK